MHELFDTFVAEDTDLHVNAVHAIAKLLYLKRRHLALVLQVMLGTNYDNVLDWEFTVEVVLVDPVVEMVE